MRIKLTIGRTLLMSGALTLAPAFAQDNGMQFKLGGFFPSGGGEFWAETEDVFTFSTSDLNDVVWGFSFVHSANNHVELGVNVDGYSGWTVSSYRDFVDDRGFLIQNDTRLRSYPLSVDVRFVPAGRFATRGPRDGRDQRPVFYVGGGIGANFWSYEETGDFIDFGDPDLPVFFGRFADSGTAFEAHALTGIELPIGRHFSFLAEAKYTWSEATLDASFPVDTRDLDLGGLAMSAGVSIRF